jgi:hypothetical protein
LRNFFGQDEADFAENTASVAKNRFLCDLVEPESAPGGKRFSQISPNFLKQDLHIPYNCVMMYLAV